MENIEHLIKLIFKKHVEEDSSYDYDTLDILRGAVAKIEFEKSNPQGWYRERDFQNFYDAEKSLDDLLHSGYIGFAVRTGGHSGGNCWGGEASYEAESHVNLYNDYLDKILEAIAPEVTYLTYRKIEKNIIKNLEYTKYEYYGNDDIYHVQLIPIKELVLMLDEKKSLTSQENIENLIVQYQTVQNTRKLKK